jgi:Ca2+-binding RTX toxin-like protein
LLGGAGRDRLFGEGWSASLSGQGGRDLLTGGTGHDTLSGGFGRGTLVGGSGFDLFVFEDGFGKDTLRDFDADDREKIDFSQVAEIESFADLVTNHLSEIEGDAVVSVGNHALRLKGISVLEIGSGLAYSEHDFMF